MLRIIICILYALSHSSIAAGYTRYSDRPDVRTFIDTLTSRHQMNRAELLGIFRDTEPQTRALEILAKPAETALTWKQYRPIFLNESRIEAGIQFWLEHKPLLERAEKQYNIPPEIILAIIGIETKYGKNTGNFPILPTLITLAFDYEPRKPFFQSELEQFFLLARDEQLDFYNLNGSYAGAMGMPQFISSSYRNLSVDFDQNGQRDLWSSPADVIGSIANYFQTHKWQPAGPITSPASLTTDPGELAISRGRKGLKPEKTLAEFAALDIHTTEKIDDDQPATLIRLEGENGDEYWFGFSNFYVITRYNQSAMYAMAVYQLSQQLRSRMTETLRNQTKTQKKH